MASKMPSRSSNIDQEVCLQSVGRKKCISRVELVVDEKDSKAGTLNIKHAQASQKGNYAYTPYRRIH